MIYQSIAPDANDPAPTVRITHPFHPRRGQPVPVVTIRHSWGEDLIFYHDQKGRLVTMPARWTDAVPPDPVVVIADGRAPFRLADLLELTRLVTALRQEATRDR